MHHGTRRAIFARLYAKASAKSRNNDHVSASDVMSLVDTNLTAAAGRPAIRGRVVGRAARSSASSEVGFAGAPAGTASPTL